MEGVRALREEEKEKSAPLKIRIMLNISFVSYSSNIFSFNSCINTSKYVSVRYKKRISHNKFQRKLTHITNTAVIN